jgi:intracellular sulfur oxidation DsrE/DsrF family protein
MSRHQLLRGLALSVVAATVAAAQPVITHPQANYAPVPNVDFGGEALLTYRFAWAIAEAADSAGQITPGFLAPARMLNTLIADGVPRTRIQLAIVARGPAAAELLDNAAYRARFNRDNPNLPLLEQLAKQGVTIIACGQTIVGRKLPRDSFPAFVKVSRAATVAQARLAAEGFAFNPF